MIRLAGKEIRFILRSVVFYVFIIAAGFSYFSQYATEETWGEVGPPSTAAPQNIGTEEHPYYGWKLPDNTSELAGRMRTKIGWNLDGGTTTRLRIGFPTETRLSDADKEALTKADSRLEEILKDPDKYKMEDVYKVSDELNRQLGGNSMYKRGTEQFGFPIETYEEAVLVQQINLEHYDEKVQAGELLPGAARYFCDYMSLSAGIFPVFMSAFLLLRDRSSRMNELIYCRRISSWSYVGSKFIALGTMLSLVYLVLAAVGGWQTVKVLELEGQWSEAILTFLGYTAGWLLPTIWTSVAFGLFGSMLFRRGIVPIALQIIWWFVSVLPLMGSYGLYRLFIRFNSPGDSELYHEWIQEIAVNRSFYVLLALLLAGGAALLWERNRSCIDAGQSGGQRRKRPSGRKTKAALEAA
jgi:hypothetical protein